jgi:SAM-dependent methyltransferase
LVCDVKNEEVIVQKLIRQTIKRLFPNIVPYVKDLRGFLRANLYRINLSGKPKFTCPICNYSGPFVDFNKTKQIIKHTKCPKCELYERHRLQYLVIKEIESRHNLSKLAILHFAPELAFERLFNKKFGEHYTADLIDEGVDYQVDICRLPFKNDSFDVIFASHVLEHVIDDNIALAEVVRVLKPNGFAILPVPVVSPVTIEYNSLNPYEFGHVRAIGIDYFDKYKKFFSKVEIWDSADFEEKYQLYTYEMRSCYPTSTSPLRQPMDGVKHLDYVPVCFK